MFLDWKLYCLLTIVLYTIHDVLLKILSKSIPSGILSLCINLIATLGIGFLIYAQLGQQFQSLKLQSMKTVLLLLLCAIALGWATISFSKAFSLNAPFSIAIPLVYVSIIILSELLGVFIFKEPTGIVKLLGIVITSIGLYLIFYKKP